MTSIFDLEKNVKIAKDALAKARKEKADSTTINNLKKHLKTQETILKAAKKALGQ